MRNRETQSYRDALVETLRTEGDLFSEPITAAFATVPRHLFITTYYERQGDTWQQLTATRSEEWYRQVYCNQAIITLVDQTGRVLSSSSQPGIMARMLESLDLQPGQRVLEIGTGTGYNAAMLATIVGANGQVVTMDIEAEIVAAARQHLRRAGYERVQVVHGDGRDGYPSAAPYDRIIATGSTFRVPLAWQEQLSPEGILVCVVQPGRSIAGGVQQAVKTADGLAGRLVQIASFMPLHGEQFRSSPANRPHLNLSEPAIAVFPFSTRLFDPTVIWTADFQFFLYASLPMLRIVEQTRADHRTYSLLYEEQRPEQSVALFQEEDQHHVELRGEAAPALWTRLIRVYTLWAALDHPAIPSYQFKMRSGEQQHLSLASEHGMVWPFL